MNAFNSEGVFTPLQDIADFHVRFGLEQNNTKVAVADSPPPEVDEDGVGETEFQKWLHINRDKMLPEEWELRHRRLADEAMEYQDAVEHGDNEAALDALVDIIYIALGTAYRRGWDFAEAWRRVHKANMAKERGEKNNSKYGSTFDIVKPKGWVGPDHSDLV